MVQQRHHRHEQDHGCQNAAPDPGLGHGQKDRSEQLRDARRELPAQIALPQGTRRRQMQGRGQSEQDGKRMDRPDLSADTVRQHGAAGVHAVRAAGVLVLAAQYSDRNYELLAKAEGHCAGQPYSFSDVDGFKPSHHCVCAGHFLEFTAVERCHGQRSVAQYEPYVFFRPTCFHN